MNTAWQFWNMKSLEVSVNSLLIVLKFTHGSWTKIFPNSSIRKNIIGEVTGFDRDETSNACELVSSLTGDNTREVVSFGTEAGLFQEIGISTVVCGPGSIEQAHKIDEFIILDELKKCLNLLEVIKDNSIVN